MKTKIKYFAILLLLAFVINVPINANAQAASRVNKDISTYGDAAVTFGSLLDENQVNNSVTVVSEVSNLNMASIQSSINGKNTLVAINLPIDNPLISVPTLQYQNNQTLYKFDRSTNTSQIVNATDDPLQTVNPTYWIGVIHFGTPESISFFLTTNNSEAVIQKIANQALEAVETVPKPQIEYLSKSATTNTMQPLLDLELQPFDTDKWIFRYELDYTLDLGYNDEVSAHHSIYQCVSWDNVKHVEYWAVNSYYTHDFENYEFYTDWWNGEAHIGPYLSQTRNYIQADIQNQEYDGLYSYGPGATSLNGEATVNIGLSVSRDGPSLDASYGWSWTIPGVWYDAYANNGNAYSETLENYHNGRDNYFYWLFDPYMDISTAAPAHESYPTTFTAVFQPPAESGLDITTLQSTWYFCDDHIYWGVYIQNQDYQWTAYWDPARMPSQFASQSTDYYASSLPSEYPSNPYTYGNAGYSNPSYLLGSTNDNYAYIYAQSNNAMCQIFTQLNDEAPNGHITIVGYTNRYVSSNSRLLVYVSDTNSNWQLIKDQYIYGNTHYPIDGGYVDHQFRYILLVAYDSGVPSALYIDSITVES